MIVVGEDMNYTMEPSADGLHIVVKVHGDITRRDALQLNLEAHALGRQLGTDCYLIDVTEARNVDPATEIYGFAYSDMVNANGIDRSAFIAVVANPDDHSHDFAETVCGNAGFHVTIFRDRREAVQALAGAKLPEETRSDRKAENGCERRGTPGVGY